MYKLLLVLVAVLACVYAAQDQEAAEQYFARFGYYPSWYNYGVRSAVYPGAYSYAAPAAYGYSYNTYPYSYGYNYAGYKYVY